MSTIKKSLMMFMRLILASFAMSIAYIELMSSTLLFGVVTGWILSARIRRLSKSGSSKRPQSWPPVLTRDDHRLVQDAINHYAIKEKKNECTKHQELDNQYP